MVDLGIISPVMNIEKLRDFSLSRKYIDIFSHKLGNFIPWDKLVRVLSPDRFKTDICLLLVMSYLIIFCLSGSYFLSYPSSLREFILLNPERDYAVLPLPLLSICCSHKWVEVSLLTLVLRSFQHGTLLDSL